jgi:hypothetical protein
VSRDIDGCSLNKISEIFGRRQIFGLHQRFDNFECGGLYKQPVQYKRETAHKSRAQGAPSSLGVYTYANQHISKEENEIISGA